MSLINVTNIVVQDSKAAFNEPIAVEVSFESMQALKEPIVWKITYIGNPADPSNDQILEEVEVSVEDACPMRFTLQVYFVHFILNRLQLPMPLKSDRKT